jgi:hypothetical protein
MFFSGHNPDLQTGNIGLLYEGLNLNNFSLKIKISLSTLVYLSRTPYIFCMCVVSWQARRQKLIQPPAYSGATSKTTSNSLLWFPMPADRHFSCSTIFAGNDKKTKKKKNYFYFLLFLIAKIYAFYEKNIKKVVIFWPICALNFVRIYRAHPVQLA